MTTYRTPIDDMRFVMRELAELDSLCLMPGCDQASSDLVDAILAEAGRFGAEVLAPLNASGDRQGCRLENGVVRAPDGFADAYRQFVDGGWNGIGLPAEHGGQGLPALVSTAVSEIWSAANMAFGLCPMLTQAAAELLERHGDAPMRARYLPDLVSGAWTGTMQLTEPQAGSDLGQVRTRAVPRDRGAYSLFGQKIYITFGEHDMAPNIVHAVLARTPSAPPGIKGLSLFLVPKYPAGDDGTLGAANDLRCVSLEHKLGIRGSPTAVMSMGDDGGAIGYLIGEENRGLEMMFTMMNTARLAVGLQGVGIGDRAYQQARSYAFERIQGRALGESAPDPVAIARHPDVQRMLLTMKAETEAARALAYVTAATLDRARHHPDGQTRARCQRRVDLLTPVVKAWCTDTGIGIADQAIQVHGGMGYIEESGVPQFLRDARILSIYEGTNGIQALDLVGRKVTLDDGLAMRELLGDIDGSLGDEAPPGSDQPAIRDRLGAALHEMIDATRWLLETYAREPRRVAAGAVYYLRLTGNVVGGWLMWQAAQRAAARLAHGGGERRFLVAKIKTARCFADTRLAECAGLADKFRTAADVLRELDPNQHL